MPELDPRAGPVRRSVVRAAALPHESGAWSVKHMGGQGDVDAPKLHTLSSMLFNRISTIGAGPQSESSLESELPCPSAGAEGAGARSAMATRLPSTARDAVFRACTSAGFPAIQDVMPVTSP